MGIFNNILEKLGLKKPAAAPTATTKAPQQRPVPDARLGADSIRSRIPNVNTKIGAVPMAAVDVVSKLEKMAVANPEKLDWKTSIVDLLKLVGIDSSLDSRKALAVELGCPADKMGGDYADMNVWLHKAVLRKIAENGGNIPASLLD